MKEVPKKYNPLVGIVFLAVGIFAWYGLLHHGKSSSQASSVPDYIWYMIPTCFLFVGLTAILERFIGEFLTLVLLLGVGISFFTVMAYLFLQMVYPPADNKPYLPVILSIVASVAYYKKFRRY